jgi:hypothetical protein
MKNGVVFQMDGISDRRIKVDESTDPERATVSMTAWGPQCSRTFRLIGVQDLRTLGEVGASDEVRVIDLNVLEGNQLEFGRYRFEWRSGGELDYSFELDGFEVVG